MTQAVHVHLWLAMPRRLRRADACVLVALYHKQLVFEQKNQHPCVHAPQYPDACVVLVLVRDSGSGRVTIDRCGAHCALTWLSCHTGCTTAVHLPPACKQWQA